MAPDDLPTIAPLQLIVVGFETTERFDGQIARELRDLRGRGLVRVLDARLLSRGRDGKLTEVDLNQIIGEPVGEHVRSPICSGSTAWGRRPGTAASRPPEAYARTAGFALEDLRRLTDEIGHGEHAAVLLVEHVWAARVQALVRERGGQLLAQGMLTPEVMMIVGAELQAKADAQAAIELADAARGAALLEALATLTGEQRPEDARRPWPPPRSSGRSSRTASSPATRRATRSRRSPSAASSSRRSSTARSRRPRSCWTRPRTSRRRRDA